MGGRQRVSVLELVKNWATPTRAVADGLFSRRENFLSLNGPGFGMQVRPTVHNHSLV